MNSTGSSKLYGTTLVEAARALWKGVSWGIGIGHVWPTRKRKWRLLKKASVSLALAFGAPSIVLAIGQNARGTIDLTGSCSGFPEAQCDSGRQGSSGQASIDRDVIASCSSSGEVARPVTAEIDVRLAAFSSGALGDGSIADRWCNSENVKCVGLPRNTLLSVWKSTSAVLSPLEDKVIMPCVEQGTMFSYDLVTGSATMMSHRLDQKALMVRRSRDEIIVEHGEGILVRYSEGSRTDPIDLRDALNEDWVIDAVRDWHYRTGEVFAFAEIFPTECIGRKESSDCIEQWRFALVRIALDPRISFEPVLMDPIQALPRKYALLSNSYIAELEGVVYALMPGEPSQIVTLKGGQAAVAKPIDPLVASSFDLMSYNMSDIGRVYGSVRNALSEVGPDSGVFPVSLIGWNGRLYLVYMSAGEGSVGRWNIEWRMVRLDPRSHSTIGPPVELPTTSARVLVVPGRCNWILIEHLDERSTTGGLDSRPTLVKLWPFQEVEY